MMNTATEYVYDYETQDCLTIGWGYITSEYAAGELVGSLVVCFIAAVAISPLVLGLYQRKVRKLMRNVAEDGRAEDALSEKEQDSLVIEATDALSLDTAARVPTSISQRMAISHGAISSAAITFVIGAGLVFGAAAMFYAENWTGTLWQWTLALAEGLLIAGCLVAPLALSDSPERYRRRLLLIPFALFLVILLIKLVAEDGLPVGDRIIMAVYGIVMISMLYLSLIGRRLRNVVPLLTLLIFLLLTSLYVVTALIDLFEACNSEYSDGFLILVKLVFCGFLVWLGMKLLDKITRAYEQQIFSDSQFQIGLWFLIIVIFFSMEPRPIHQDAIFNAWSLGVLLSGALAVQVYLKKLKTQPAWDSPLPMLLLRVFSKQRRAQDFLDELTYQWSFIGPIYLVGGPDLAKTYIEPHELLLFLRRRMGNFFVRSKKDLIERLQNLVVKPDPDGRFRINEFFCDANTWRFTVRQLVKFTPAIVLDLRGFDKNRGGTAFEVTLLAEMGALDKTMFLYDESTDMGLVEKALKDVPGASISPTRLIDLDEYKDCAKVLKLLTASEK